MKQRLIFRKAITIWLLICSLFLIGCTQDSPLIPEKREQAGRETVEQNQSDVNNSDEENVVSITIKGLDTTILPETTVPIERDDTIFAITLRILQEEGIPYSVSGAGALAYVEGIGDLYEFDHGPTSGWLVKKNGELIGHSSGIESVEPGDTIEWYYSTDPEQ